MGDRSGGRGAVSRRELLRGAAGVGGGGLAAVGTGALGLTGGGLISRRRDAPGALEAWALIADDLRLHSREEWRAAPPRRPATVLADNPDKIVIHHTASPNSEDGSQRHAYALSRAIQHFHMKGRGWDDTGQHFTISRGGHVMEGRNRTLEVIGQGRKVGGLLDMVLPRRVGHVVGAHTLHHNERAVGIENEGTYMDAAVPDPLWQSLVRLCALLCAIYDLDPKHAIVGHRDFNPTSCPGDVLYAALPTLRRSVERLLV